MRVVGAVIFYQEKILVAKRSTGQLAGFWEFPGGKVEVGESEEQALVREIDEELGLKIEVGDKLGEFPHQFPGGNILLVAYIAYATTFDFELREHQAGRWVEFKNLNQMQLAPADISVIPALKQWLAANDASP